MVFKKDGEFWVGGNKHRGETLDEVAASDPGYLNWLWNDPDMLGEMTDEVQDKLEMVMESNNISFEKRKMGRGRK